MSRFFCVAFAIGLLASCSTDPECCAIAPAFELESELLALISDFEGDVGIYVEHLQNGQTVEINADTLFPTASMIKVPILLDYVAKVVGLS